MARPAAHYKFASSGPEREALRVKGQFWTPEWVAKAMVRYVLSGGSQSVFDPAVGGGVFFRMAKEVAAEKGEAITLRGTELHENALDDARAFGLTDADLAGVEITDFLRSLDTLAVLGNRPWSDREETAIVANPPYIRHHRLAADVKRTLKEYGARLIGCPLDGRAGYHVYFLLHALSSLAPGGRLAFIMPADTAEGVSAGRLWRWITSRYRLNAVVTFRPEATPFPGVDTNAVVFMLENSTPKAEFRWLRCREAATAALDSWVQNGFEGPATLGECLTRTVEEAVTTGLSREPRPPYDGPILSDYASVMRGIATGANDFFFMTKREADERGIPAEFLVRAIGRTRDLPGDVVEITSEHMEALDQKGHATYLFSPDGRAISEYPPAVQAYLEEGVTSGIDQRSLIAQRRPWYKMETRKPPQFLFAYLGRRNVRFVLNSAGVVPLTGFLCVYLYDQNADCRKMLEVLNSQETLAGLASVGKSYGDGALKVEPRSLDRLPLPNAEQELGQAKPSLPKQLRLLERKKHGTSTG
ncbi:MAG: N-6 DNA methylase [Fimbriimonadaceae bacterium]|nr:N-6 DNA methylase [Fimbriimonadaceae bacterium]